MECRQVRANLVKRVLSVLYSKADMVKYAEMRAPAKNETRVLQQTGLGALRKVGSLLRGTQSSHQLVLISRPVQAELVSSQRGTDIACGVSSTVRFVTPPPRREALNTGKLSLPKDGISRQS